MHQTWPLFVVLFAAGAAAAQERKVEITPFLGYQFGDSGISPAGEFRIDPDISYGLAVDVLVRPDAALQFLYTRQETALDFRDNDPFFPRRALVDLAVEYYHLGGTVIFGERERLRPYFALTVGATRFQPQVEGFSSEWRFSAGIGLGVKTYMTPRFGLRLEGRVLPSFVNTDGGFLCSLPGACLLELSTDFITQGNVTAGFFVVF